MRTKALIALFAVLALVAAACGDSEETTTTAAGTTTQAPGTTGETTTTTEAMTGTYTELCPPEEAPSTMTLGLWAGAQTDEVVLPGLANFMEETGVEVVSTGDGTGDRLAKIRSAAGLDVAVVPVNEVTPLLNEGFILETDENIPHYENLIDEAKIGGGYGTSLLVDVIAHNPEFVPEAPDSWLDILDEAYAGHIAVGNIPGANGYAALAMVNRELGGTDDDLMPALEAFAEASEGFLTLIDFGPGMEPLVESGDLWIYPEIAGLLQIFIQGGGPLELVIPPTGGAAMMNVAVIPVDNQHEGCSKALVAALIGAEVQANYVERFFYYPVNDSVEIPADIRDLVLPRPGEEIVQIDWAAINARAEEYIDFWNRNVAGGG